MINPAGAAWKTPAPEHRICAPADQRHTEWTEGDFAEGTQESSDGESKTDGAVLLLESSLRDLMDTHTTELTETGVEPWGQKVRMAVDLSVKDLPLRTQTKNQGRGNSAYTSSKTVLKSRNWLASLDDRFLEHPQKKIPTYDYNAYNPSTVHSFAENRDVQSISKSLIKNHNSPFYDGRRDSCANQSTDKPKREFLRNSAVKKWTYPGEPILRVKLKDIRRFGDSSSDNTKNSNFFYTGSASIDDHRVDANIFKTQEHSPNAEYKSFLELQKTAARQDKLGEVGSHTRALRAALFGYTQPKATIVKPSAHGVLSLEVTLNNSRVVCQSPPRKAVIMPHPKNKATNTSAVIQTGGVGTQIIRRAINLGGRPTSRSISRTKEDLMGYGSKIGIFPNEKESKLNLGSSLNLSRPISQKPILTSHLHRILARSPDFSFQMTRNREHLILKKPQASGQVIQPESLRARSNF